jgi:hypothetical protein
MGSATEPETYLRLTCERMMAGDPSHGRNLGGGDVPAVGRALVAAGRLDEETVLAIVDEYALAMGVRGGHRFPLMRSLGPEPPADLSSHRVVPGDFEVISGDQRMVIGKIVFTEDKVELQATGTLSSSDGPARPGRGRMRGFAAMGPRTQPARLALVDDRGVTATASAHGWSGSGLSWQATLLSDRPLSPHAEWIEVEGIRIVLPPRPPPAAVKTEAIEPEDGITSALQQEMASGWQGQNSLEEFIRTLEAIQAVDAQTPAVLDARRVAAALASGTPARGVGPPWDAVFRRSARSDGPVGRMAIGAAVGSVAGFSIRLDSLTSAAEGFSVDVAASPGWILLHHFPAFNLDPSPIMWWAEDDRNNRYFGLPDSPGGGGSVAEGTIIFITPLDPAASSLRLLPTARRERAIVTVALDQLG